MLKRYYVTPENSYKFGGDNKVNYTPVVVVQSEDHAHVYVAGRVSRDINGDVVCIGDMRGQIRKSCENVKIALEAVGARLEDVTRTTTYTTDIKAYFAASDERFKFFRQPLPTSTLVAVSALAKPELLVEIEVEAIIEPDRISISSGSTGSPKV
jgi:enamine deaminase RidA (YjgF/YER057c/UK114 family)